MATIAIYSLKGGVGKTSITVNLAWASASISKRSTLLWDLDPQAAASWLLSKEPPSGQAQAIFSKDVDPRKLMRPSTVERLDLIAADTSLRGLDRLFFELDKKKRLSRLIEGLGKDHNRILLDCPPGLSETSEQVLRAADIVIVPVIPSPLSRRAFDEVISFLARKGGKHPAMLPVYSMVDRRRLVHREALAAQPDWPVIPMASLVEKMATERKPIGEMSRTAPAAQAFADLWAAIERRLAKG